MLRAFSCVRKYWDLSAKKTQSVKIDRTSGPICEMSARRQAREAWCRKSAVPSLDPSSSGDISTSGCEANDRLLLKLVSREFADDGSVANNERSVGDGHDLRRFGRDKDHGGAAIAFASDRCEHVDVGADVDPLRRVLQYEAVRALENPARGDDALAV